MENDGQLDWGRVVDNYCERIGAEPAFWGEPLNAVSNIAFFIGAWLAWRAARDAGRLDRGVWALLAVLVSIGTASFLFHTLATRFWGAADALTILVFILVYVHLATVRLIGAPVWAGPAAVAAFIPVSAALGWLVAAVLGPLNGSAGYGAVWLVIVGYGVALAWIGRPAPARGFAIGAGLLFVSLAFRTMDAEAGPVCGAFNVGTHWLWHLLNGAMLGWMIVVMVRHGARGQAAAERAA